jgi:hypothetical protein
LRWATGIKKSRTFSRLDQKNRADSRARQSEMRVLDYTRWILAAKEPNWNVETKTFAAKIERSEPTPNVHA